MIKGVFLDLCGTLLIYGDMEAAWQKWLKTGYACMRQSGLSVSEKEFADYCDGMFRKPEPPTQNDGLTVYERRVQALYRDLRLTPKIEDIRRTSMQTVQAWAGYMHLDPECCSVLESIEDRMTLAMITNFDHPPYVDILLENTGLNKYFNTVIVSAAVGMKKPDPGIFRLALQKTGLNPYEVIHVGDSLEDDIAGANSAGVKPVFLQREQSGYSESNNDPFNRHLGSKVPLGVTTIHGLSELIDLVR